MEALGQLTAARVASSPAVAALTASCSRQSPGNLQWIKGSTAVATAIGHFHGVGLLSREGTTYRGSDGGDLLRLRGRISRHFLRTDRLFWTPHGCRLPSRHPCSI
ncbi:hypothetical protein [Paenarthrobacter sp. Y-19]|uniref:hypothetical protein n=1 Tax=Paenarthrobacter sp. Y-19 TaxID=3031125 RepID=UPI0023DBF7A2|nr:hypothetical protein [Paenarthrobacter sp. Y-19]